jgi:hypothetical protein
MPIWLAKLCLLVMRAQVTGREITSRQLFVRFKQGTIMETDRPGGVVEMHSWHVYVLAKAITSCEVVGWHTRHSLPWRSSVYLRPREACLVQLFPKIS